MGYADLLDLQYTSKTQPASINDGHENTTSTFTDDEQSQGFRAAITRKRRSLFGGRPESMTSFTDLTTKKLPQSLSAVKPSEPIQGVLYHNLPEQRPKSNGRRSTDPSGNRLSFFGSRFKLGQKKESVPHLPVREERKETEPQAVRPQHVRGISAPADVIVEQKSQRYPTEDEYYREHTKSSISPPYDFEHVTHTRKKHLPALETVDEKELNREFQAKSATRPQSKLQGIQAEHIIPKLKALGVPRGSPSSRPNTPGAETTAMPLIRPAIQPRKSSSKEDITALPAAQAKKSRREELGSFLGLRPNQQQKVDEKSAAHESALNSLTGGQEKPKRAASTRSISDRQMRAILAAQAHAYQYVAPAQTQPKPKSDESTQQPKPSMDERIPDRNVLAAQAHAYQYVAPARDLPKSKSHDSTQPPKASMDERIPDRNVLAAQAHAYQYVAPAREQPKPQKSKSHDSSQPQPKVSMESRSSDGKTSRSFLGSKERSMSDSTTASSKAKREDLGALLGIKEERRRSKVSPDKQDELHALLGMAPQKKKKFVPMQPPAPPRPRRSDEMRREMSPSAPSPALSAPERPRRDSKDVQYLQNTGFGQLLYRANSAESHHSPASSTSNAYYAPSPILDSRRTSSPNDDLAGDLDQFPTSRAQQVRYRNKQPLPAIPDHHSISSEGRSPLQTVSEHAMEAYSPLPTPVDSAISPKSPTSMHSAQKSVGTIKSAELTGPDVMDDEAWEAEIDFLYKQQAEATHEFDWDNVAMTPQRLSALRDADKRLSLNIPAAIGPAATLRLSKKLSEGSLRSSLYSPVPQAQQTVYSRAYQGAPRHSSPLGGRKLEEVMPYVSPEVNVVDVDDGRSVNSIPVSQLPMHGYESVTAGYLSDPESLNSGSHRKSNSYSSWESRAVQAKDSQLQSQMQGRSSRNSVTSVPELTHSIRRGPKEPITSIYQLDQQPLQPAEPQKPASHVNRLPMHEYAMFNQNPYGSSQETSEYVSHYRPDVIDEREAPRMKVHNYVQQARAEARAEATKYSKLVYSASVVPAYQREEQREQAWI